MKYLRLLVTILSVTTFVSLSIAQTDEQLRDPEFLVDQYNQLVAKHNALIEKTRLLISDKSRIPAPSPIDDNLARNQLNDALAKVSVLEGKIDQIKQQELRSNSGKVYLEDSNSRLRRQLLESKADLQDLIQRNKELTAQNKKLTNSKESFNSQEKSSYSKIRTLERENSTLERKLNDLRADNNTLSAIKNKFQKQIDGLEKDLGLSKQQLARLEIEKENQRMRLRDAEAISKSKDELNKSLENTEESYRTEIDALENEVVRLAGVESLLKERNLNNERENELLEDRIRNANINASALQEEVDSLRDLSNDLKFEVRRKNEQLVDLNSLNEDLAMESEGFRKRNQNLQFSDSAMKGELSNLKSELNSLGIEEAKISDKMDGIRDANEMLLSKVKMLEAENDGMKQAIDLMRIEVQDMNANEQALVNKLKDIDFQNKQLLKESTSMDGESKFFKDKVRQLEIQLSQAVANERILNENLRSSEESVAQLSNKLNSLADKESIEFANLAQEVQFLQTQLNNIVGQEMALQTSIKSLEAENIRLNNELQRTMGQMSDYTREISILNKSNEKLIDEIESTQNMRVRLRNDIIGVIDQNDQVLPKGY